MFWRKRIIVSFDEKQFEAIAALMRTSDILVLESMAKLHKRMINMSAQLNEISTEVHESTTVMASAAALIDGLADKIDALKEDPQALGELAAELRTAKVGLAASVEANTDPVETPAPVEDMPLVDPPADPTPPSE